MIRILFVDDDLNVLQAMRRSLHNMRGEWDMQFVLSGDAALEELAKTPADVVVTDMRMPGMDGWQLLGKVKELQPQTVRLILSGEADASSIMRAVGIAHQYLAKPCESQALKAAISSTQALRRLLSSERLAPMVSEVGMLPSAPKAFQEILSCLQGPTASIADAARIIARDVAMTANVIKMVNSAFFGSRRPVSTADRAVAYLGLDTLGALVLGHSAFKSGVASGIKGFSLEQLWQHSLDVAVAARAVAVYQNFPQPKADEAFLAGMLHDVGKVVFATRAAVAADAGAATDRELSVQMDLHHAEVGAYLLGLWGFPNPIVEAVAFHHAPSQAAGDGLSLPSLIHIAEQLVRERRPTDQRSCEGELEPGLLEKLGLADRWPAWLAELNSLDSEEAPA
jgi:putative nucleotidyltransferase with HDIG domain